MPILNSYRKEFDVNGSKKFIYLLPNNSDVNRQLNDTLISLADSFSYLSNPQTIYVQSDNGSNPGSTIDSSFKGLLNSSYPLIDPNGDTFGSLTFNNTGILLYSNSALYTIITPNGLSAEGGTLKGSYIYGGTITGAYIFGSSISAGSFTGGTIYGGTIIGGSISGASISGGSIYIGTPVAGVFPFQVNSFGSFTSSSGVPI